MTIRRLRSLVFLASLFFLAFVWTAIAQDAPPTAAAQIVISDPTGGYLAAVPGGIYIYGLLVMIAGLVSVFVKDGSMPVLLRKVINFLAMNGGAAANDPTKNMPSKG